MADNKKLVFCSSCMYYKKLTGHCGVSGLCNNPANLKLKRNWCDEWNEHILKPSKLNKNNDCLWYKPKGL